MGRHLHIKFEIPYKGVIETRSIKLFRSENKLTKENVELELRQTIGEPEIKIVEFLSFPENHAF
jgi:hypothetical protein